MIQVRNLINLIRICDRFVCKHGHLRVSFCTASGQKDQPVTNFELKELDPLPEYLEHRQKLWDKFRICFLKDLKTRIPTTIRVKVCGKDSDDREVDIKSWKSTPFDVARNIGTKEWLESLVICKVNGKLWDLERPLEEDCSIEFLTFEDDEGSNVSNELLKSSHIIDLTFDHLHSQVERYFGIHPLIFWVKPWRDYMAVICAMVHQ